MQGKTSNKIKAGEMVARVKAHIARFDRLTGKDKVLQKPSLELGPLKLEESSRRVFLKDKEIFLTTKEFDILVYLMNQPDRVFSKEEIFTHIWGEAYGDLSTVTVHIRKLREKIEADPSDPKIIETIWGVGYRFSP